MRITKESFQDGELSNKLLLTTWQKTKVPNVFAKNMSTDIKLSKAQLSKIIKSGGLFGNMMGNLVKKSVNRSHWFFG